MLMVVERGAEVRAGTFVAHTSSPRLASASDHKFPFDITCTDGYA